MQPRILISAFALTLGASGIAFAGDAKDHAKHAKHSVEARMDLTREQAMELQRALRARNLYQGEIDGVWGKKTQSALRNFQTQSGIEPTGVLTERTAEALGIKWHVNGDHQRSDDERRAKRRTKDNEQRARQDQSQSDTQQSAAKGQNDTGTVQLQTLNEKQARELQQRLQMLGYYHGAIDGKLGQSTRDALARYFSKQANLARNGVISASEISLFGTPVNEIARND